MSLFSFIEGHFYVLLVLLAVMYVSWDLWRSRKDIGIKKGKKSLEGFLNAVKEAGFKHYLIAFGMFLLVFLVVRGIVVVQNEAQTCEVWPTESLYYPYVRYGSQGGEFWENYYMELNKLEQGRSWNYYNRWFNEKGGMARFVNINCSLSLNGERFINNLILDYNERGK